MRPGIMDNQQVPDINLRQHAVNRKFVIILTKGACDIVFVVAHAIVLTHDCDMVVSAVHRRTHQIHGTGIASYILLMGMLFMDGTRNQTSVRSHHEASQFCINCHVAHTCRDKHFLINFAHPLTNRTNIIGLLVRTVGNADSA